MDVARFEGNPHVVTTTDTVESSIKLLFCCCFLCLGYALLLRTGLGAARCVCCRASTFSRGAGSLLLLLFLHSEQWSSLFDYLNEVCKPEIRVLEVLKH